MVRARLRFLALAGGVLLASGCACMHPSECDSGGGGWFSRFHLASRHTAAPCECENAGLSYSGTDGSIVVPPNAYVPPTTYTSPAPTIISNPPAVGQPPRVVPIPQQANPSPYTPSN